MAKASLLGRAVSSAGALVDRGALRVMERAMTGGAGRTPRGRPRERLLALAAHYAEVGESFFAVPEACAVSEVAVAGRRGAFDLSFESCYRPSRLDYVDELASYAANGVARARLLTGGDRPRPTVVWIHGWGGGSFWLEERLAAAGTWLRRGYDVCLVQLPFHGLRAPAQAPRSGALFPGVNALRTNEGFGQAIFDLRGFADHLRGRGAPAIGVVGMSLGAYTAALWASLDALDFCVALVPATDLAELLWRHGGASRVRRRAEASGVDRALLAEVFAVHAPTARPVVVAPERLAIVAGRGDRVCPPDQAERLRQHWGIDRVRWFSGGHLAQIGRGRAMDAVFGELADFPGLT